MDPLFYSKIKREINNSIYKLNEELKKVTYKKEKVVQKKKERRETH